MNRTVAVRASSSNREVSAQTSAMTGGLSQKKWFTLLGPQKGKLKIHVVCTVATGNPENQEAALSSSEEEEEVHLGSTAEEGDGCVLNNQGPQHLGHNNQVETYLQERQVPKEEVHRTLEGRVSCSNQDYEDVSHQGNKVNGQKKEKQQSL